MNCVFSTQYATKMSGRLYLGNIYAANDRHLLKEHHITAVLSIIDTSDTRVDPSVSHLVSVPPIIP